MKKINFYNFVLVFMIVFCLILLVSQNSGIISGNVAEFPVSSNVSINKYLAISFGDNLSEGILFGDVAVLPATNINASHNYDGASNATTLYISISEDGNTAVDFCTKADEALTSIANDTIELGNETYANSTTTNLGTPGAATNSTALTTSYVKSGYNIALGGTNYYRFWLDVPAAQPSGDYNNSISFKGVQTGLSC